MPPDLAAPRLHLRGVAQPRESDMNTTQRRAPTAADVVALIANLEAACFTGRVQITLDFSRGGVSRLQAAEVTPLV